MAIENITENAAFAPDEKMLHLSESFKKMDIFNLAFQKKCTCK